MMAPFMKTDENGRNGVRWIRIVETIISAIVVAGLTAGITLYTLVSVMGAKVDSIKTNVSELKTIVCKQDDRLRLAEIKLAAHESKRSH